MNIDKVYYVFNDVNSLGEELCYTAEDLIKYGSPVDSLGDAMEVENEVFVKKPDNTGLMPLTQLFSK